jgi:signal recognition particle GTPase
MQVQVESLSEEVSTLQTEALNAKTALAASSDTRKELSQTEAMLREVQDENARLVGHTNSKQKIQQHLQLKKEMVAQAEMIKEMREQLSQLTIERDVAKETARKLRQRSDENDVIKTSRSRSNITKSSCKDVVIEQPQMSRSMDPPKLGYALRSRSSNVHELARSHDENTL